MISLSEAGIKSCDENAIIKLNSQVNLVYDNFSSLNPINTLISIIRVFKNDHYYPADLGEVDYYLAFKKNNDIIKYVRCFENKSLMTEILFMNNELVLLLDINTHQNIPGPAIDTYCKIFKSNINKYERLMPTSLKLFDNVLGDLITNKITIVDSNSYIGSLDCNFRKITKSVYSHIIPKLDLGIKEVIIDNRGGVSYKDSFGTLSHVRRDYFGSGFKTLSITLPNVIDSVIKGGVCIFEPSIDPLQSVHPCLGRELVKLFSKYKHRAQIITNWYHECEVYDDLIPPDYLKTHSEKPGTLIIE